MIHLDKVHNSFAYACDNCYKDITPNSTHWHLNTIGKSIRVHLSCWDKVIEQANPDRTGIVHIGKDRKIEKVVWDNKENER